MADATNITSGNHVSNGHNVRHNGANPYQYHTEEVSHSNNEQPEFQAATSRLEEPVN